jgi:ABC-type sugar transport system ATPase subunit
LNLAIDPQTPVTQLGIGQQQLVEIAKALSQNAKILVLDEPTAALTDSEVKTLMAILEQLRAQGVGMIYISHKLNEVFSISDRITVLRDGKTIDTVQTKETSEAQVIAKMVGREVSQVFPPDTRTPKDVVFEVRGLSVEDPYTSKKIVDNVSFTVKRGEVLGISGLMGAGRSELLMAIFGAYEGRVTGEIFVAGKRLRITSPRSAIKQGHQTGHRLCYGRPQALRFGA